MLGMGPMEIAVIVVVALIIFGPGKLPEIGQTLGRAVRDFRSATSDITGDFKQTMDELQETADDFKNTALEFQHEAEETFSEAQTGLYQAAKDIEDSTSEAAAEVNENLNLDQLDSPATKPSARAEAEIAQARKEYQKPQKSAGKTSSGTKTKASSKKSASGTTKSAKSSKNTRDAKSAKSKSGDEKRPAAAKKRRQREPAALAASSAPSKDDPLADLMGVDDGPIVSSRSRSNGRRKTA